MLLEIRQAFTVPIRIFKILFFCLLSVTFLFVANSCVIDAISAGGQKTTASKYTYVYKTSKPYLNYKINLSYYKTLYPSILSANAFGKHLTVVGYVNVFNAKNTIYFAKPNWDGAGVVDNQNLFFHEYGHVAQKNLVAKVSGGYPSKSNPIRSIMYYVNTIRLNNALSHYKTTFKPKSTYLLGGYESDADCISQVLGASRTDLQYVNAKGCSREDLITAYTVLQGEWPSKKNVAQYAHINLSKQSIASKIANESLMNVIKGVDKLPDDHNDRNR